MESKQQQFEIILKPGKYIVAVSGGVDSVVLLDLLNKQPELDLIGAHFDHGIRPDSIKDKEFVAGLSEKYGLEFEHGRGDLGAGASEDTARKARYDFLESVKSKHKADAVITAHHQDDVIETAIINLIRGTRRKGLGALKSREDIIRPLIDVPRQKIERYARLRGLKWREDPSNMDTRFLRNYVRQAIIPQLNRQEPGWRENFLAKIKKSQQVNLQIDSAIEHLAENNLTIEDESISFLRSWFIMLPNAISMEVMDYAIERLGRPVNVSRNLLKSSVLFAKTARPGKKRPLSGEVVLAIGQDRLRLSAKSRS